MSSDQFNRLIAAGFSRRFLMSTCGAHSALRDAIARTPESWRCCVGCHKNYADLTRIKGPILNHKGSDLLELASPWARNAGFCSSKCASDHFGVSDDSKVYLILKTIVLASNPKTFYQSDEWKQVRYEILREQGARCSCCGRTPADNVKMHVDHIEPRSIRPDLALTKSNLQVLCEDCNYGKGARDSTDWRNGANDG